MRPHARARPRRGGRKRVEAGPDSFASISTSGAPRRDRDRKRPLRYRRLRSGDQGTMPAKVAKSGSKKTRHPAATGLSIVVPLYNEAKGLARLHERSSAVAPSHKIHARLPVEMVYVDDGSRDATRAVARNPGARPARRAGRHAVAQFRQGGRFARRPRSCAARRRAVHGRRRPASARHDRDAGRALAR